MGGGEWKIGKIENQFWFNFFRTYTAEKNDEDNDDSSDNSDDDDNAMLPVTVSQDLLGDIDDDDSIYQLISLAMLWFEGGNEYRGKSNQNMWDNVKSLFSSQTIYIKAKTMYWAKNQQIDICF